MSLTAARASASSMSHCFLLLSAAIQKSTRLLQLSLEGIGLPLGKSSLFSNLHLLAKLLLQERLGVPELSLVTLDGLVGLIVGLVGVVKSPMKLIDVSLQLLLDPQSLSLGTRFSLKRGLHGLHGTLVVFAGVIELLFLLVDLAVNLLADLSKLKLGSEDLVLLLLESSF